jgi:hypothetical protein
MDELDRMFRRLVYNIRAGFPDLIARPFEVSALHQHVIPYRLNRGELGIDTAEEYELTLMRLLSGARGLLNGDPDMQSALRAELESPNPDLSLFRAWGTASVSIAATAIRALDGQSPPVVRSPSPASPTRQAEMAGRATLELPASGAAPVATMAPPQAPRATAPGATSQAPKAAPAAPVAAAPAPKAPAPAAAKAPAPAAAKVVAAVAPVPVAAPRTHGTGCRYCGGELPEGRDAHFCPHCGQNLSIKQCPACSTELEVEWQYCITCGRQVE